jgi:glutamine synthetase type III
MREDERLGAAARKIGEGIEALSEDLTDIRADIDTLKAAAEADDVSEDTLALFDTLAEKVQTVAAAADTLAKVVPGGEGPVTTEDTPGDEEDETTQA